MSALDATIGLRSAQHVIDRWQETSPAPVVLDAGCGAARPLRLRDDAYVVGIDLSSDQLARNATLNEALCGDIQTYPLPPSKFDAVICWNTLEHLAQPRAALENFRSAIKPGGLLVIAGPNLFSLKGLATKLTPFWVHRAYYRRASVDEPFPTYLRSATAPRSLLRWAGRRRLAVRHLVFRESGFQVDARRRLKLDGGVWRACDTAVRMFTFGLVRPAATDFILVLEARA